MYSIDEFIIILEDNRRMEQFEYDLTIHSKTHIDVCIISENKSDSIECFKTKHFLMPLNENRHFDGRQVFDYIDFLGKSRQKGDD